MISDILIISKLSKNSEFFYLLFIKRKYPVILNQCNRFFCRPLCQCNVFLAAYNRHVIFLMSTVKSKNCTDNPKCCLINLALRYKAVLNSLYQFTAKILCDAHLHILTTICSFHCIIYAIDEITHNKAVKIPFILQYRAKQIFMMTAFNFVVEIVGTHNGSSTCIDTIFKMRQKYFPLCPLICVNANLKPCIFHLIECKMLYARHDILILYSAYKRCAHLPDCKRLFTISLLASTPSWIVRKVDADPGKKISAKCTCFFSDRMADRFLKIRIKRRASRHRYRKTGRLSYATYDTARTITKLHWRNYAFYSARRVRGKVVVAVITA